MAVSTATLDGIISLKRGKRIYEVIRIEKGLLITKRDGEVIAMDFPLRISFPQETFWCVEKDVNLTELESIYNMTRIKTPNGVIRFDGPEDKAKEYAESVGIKNFEIQCDSTSQSPSSATPSTSKA